MSKTLKGFLWLFMAVNLILFAPCAIVGVADVMDLIFSDFFRIYIWQYSFLIFAMPLVLARCFYVNYVFFFLLVLLQIIYFFKCREWKCKYNYKIHNAEKTIYVIVWIILIIGFLSSEHVFWGAMSV